MFYLPFSTSSPWKPNPFILYTFKVNSKSGGESVRNERLMSQVGLALSPPQTSFFNFLVLRRSSRIMCRGRGSGEVAAFVWTTIRRSSPNKRDSQREIFQDFKTPEALWAQCCRHCRVLRCPDNQRPLLAFVPRLHAAWLCRAFCWISQRGAISERSHLK